MTIITEEEIQEYTKIMFYDDGEEIMLKHLPTTSERDFVFCMIERTIGLLKRKEIDNKMIITYTQCLISVSQKETKEYNTYLKYFCTNEEARRQALLGEKLTESERKILFELMSSNLGEYLFKSDIEICCYSAMEAFLVAVYCILNKGINYNVETVDLIADLDDRLQEIHIYEADTIQDRIDVLWHSTNEINSLYTLYKSQYAGLEDESILDLVSADVIERNYYFKDERFTIAPSILMKQYLSIIEREVNIIINLSSFGNSNGKHLEWYDMKNRVRKKGIQIDFLTFKLYKALDDLYSFRNDAMHGKRITKEDYDVLLRYKSQNLFLGLSIKKLELKGIAFSPTVDEMSKWFGLFNSSKE